MTQVKLGPQFLRGKFPGHMGYRCKGMALVLLSQPCLNAKAWWCPLMSRDVGYGGREIVHPNQPVEFVRGPGPVRGEESGPTPFRSEAPHPGLSLAHFTAAPCTLLKRGWAMLTCPADLQSLSLFLLGWCPQHLSLFSLSSITATWATAWVGKHFELKLSLCLCLELNLIAILHLLQHSRKPLGALMRLI